MARKKRIFIENSSQHILLNSLENMVIFPQEEDYKLFIQILRDINEKYDIQIHAYIVMPTYFEFLATPADAQIIPKFIQSLGRKYVSYFNDKYNRTGTLWEGRYKSSLVEDSVYLLDVMKYIEQQSKNEHPYTSLQRNYFAQADSIVRQHELFKGLGNTNEQRTLRYRSFFELEADKKKLSFIEHAIEKQTITGTIEFIRNLERTVGMTLIGKGRGRPKKETLKKRKKMYKNLAVLDKEKHKDLKISPLEDLFFAKDIAYIPVAASEVATVGTTFPIVISGGENPVLMAVVSLGGESLAINSDGKWITQYVPVTLRKYPFSLGGTKENPEQKVVLIDEDSALFSKSKGKQLFKKNGEQSETLGKAIEFLAPYEKEMAITNNVVKAIVEADILEDREISVGEGDEKKVLVSGFKVVSKEKLHNLDDKILADWVRKGIISMIEAHLKSLDNIQTLFNLAHQRQS